MTSHKHVIVCMFIWWHVSWATSIIQCMLGLHLIQHSPSQHVFLVTMTSYKHVVACIFILWHRSCAIQPVNAFQGYIPSNIV